MTKADIEKKVIGAMFIKTQLSTLVKYIVSTSIIFDVILKKYFGLRLNLSGEILGRYLKIVEYEQYFSKSTFNSLSNIL